MVATKTARSVNDDKMEYINGNGVGRTVTTTTAGTIARANGKNSNNDENEVRVVNDGKWQGGNNQQQDRTTNNL